MTVAPRVVAVLLDGYEPGLEASMRAAGDLPNLAALHDRSARFELTHGAAMRTGLAGEHISTGLDPEAADRWAAVTFDPASYEAWQEGTRHPTFAHLLDRRVLAFDVPYFDLARSPSVEGIVNWGAHDPGVPPTARPSSLLDELETRVGPYPARPFLYATPWASVARCREMGEALTCAVDARTQALRWLLGERLTGWDLALVAVSEAHSVIEGLWHGIDPDHRLSGAPSAKVAGDGVRSVYRAIDRLVGAVIDTCPDATIVLFSVHGMGSNRSDVASMALLPELLHRLVFGSPRLVVPTEWQVVPGSAPALGPDERWTAVVRAAMGEEQPSSPRRWARTLSHKLRRLRRRPGASGDGAGEERRSLPWMPASHYQRDWPTMPAFALPSFYDGRIRVNLQGREAGGTVAADRYDEYCDDLEALVRACTDPATGETAVESVERPARLRGVDPRQLGPTEADLVIVWRGPLALAHPRHGVIGPLPFRRTGGHTGDHGMAYVAGDGVEPGDGGTRSAFDVVPTLFHLLDADVPEQLSGEVLPLEHRPRVHSGDPAS